jgi:hypothetical protein
MTTVQPSFTSCLPIATIGDTWPVSGALHNKTLATWYLIFSARRAEMLPQRGRKYRRKRVIRGQQGRPDD